MNLTDDISIANLSTADEKTKIEAIQVFVDSFYKQYTGISKDKLVLQKFFLESFDFELTYAAIKDGLAVGFLAIATGKERSLKFNKDKIIKLLGYIKGRITYTQLMFILGKPNLKAESNIAIDFLATAKTHRGQGIATALIEYTTQELCTEECYIDVAATNATAERLYEHVGFHEYDQERGLIPRLLGFGYIIRMKKSVNNKAGNISTGSNA